MRITAKSTDIAVRLIFVLVLICVAKPCKTSAQSGVQLWDAIASDPILSSPAINSNGTIYVGCYDRHLYSLSPSGTTNWSFVLPSAGFTGIFASPAIGPDGTVYLAAEDGYLYALDPQYGTNKWSFHVGDAVYSDPAIGADGAIYVGSYDLQGSKTSGKLYAINTNGTQRWSYTPANAIFSDPVVALDGAIYFGCDDGKLYALNTNGTLRWSFNTGPRAITASPAIGKDGKIYIGVGSINNPRFFCVNTNGTTNWVFSATNRIRSSAALGDDGTIYFGSDDNNFYALNPNGTLKWTARTGGTNASSPAIAADGTIYVGCADGKVYAFDSNTGSNSWTFQSITNIYCSPAIGTDGTIYIGSGATEAVAGKFYALSGGSPPGRTAWPMFRHDVKRTARIVTITNTPPAISSIADQTNSLNLASGPLAFLVSDGETPPASLLLSGSSSNTALVPNSQLQFSGSGSNRFLTVLPTTNQSGTTLITLTVTDAAFASNSTSFLLTVLPNHVPVAFDDAYAVNEDSVLNISAANGVLTNDTDADSNTLGALLQTSTLHGALTLNADGSFTYTPTNNYNGTDSFGYRASDGLATSGVAVVTLTINAINDPPAANDESVTTLEDTSANLGLTGSDFESPVTFAILSFPTNGVLSLFNTNAGALTYTPATNHNGSDFFRFIVSDGSLLATGNVNITIAPINDPPFAANQTVTALENTTTNLALAGGDVEGAVTFSILIAPTNGVLSLFDTNSGTVAYLPNANYVGADFLEFTVSDGSLLATGAISITVLSTNHSPVANDQSVTIPEDTTTNLVLTGSDAEGPVTFAILSAPTNGTLSLLDTNSGTVTYSPSLNFNGSDSFTFTVSDGSFWATGKVSMTISAINDAPIAFSQSITNGEDSPLAVILAGADVDGPVTNFTLLTLPSSGTLSGVEPSLTYHPATNFIGVVNFTFSVNDGSLTSSVATVTITITNINDLPIAGDQFINTPEDTTTNLVLTGSDVEGPLSFAILTSPTNGTLSLLDTHSGAVSYTPNTNYNGPDQFTFTVSDGSLVTTGAVFLTVTPLNDPPIGEDQFVTLLEDTTTNLVLIGSDMESAVTFAILSSPTNGTLSLLDTNSGAVSYTPNTNYNGVDQFTFTVSDGSLFATGHVNIAIIAVNDAPILAPITDHTIDELTTLTLTNLASDTDLPTQTLTFALLSAPTNAVINSTNGVFTWTPDETQGPSTNIIVVAVSDDGTPSLTATQTFSVIIHEVNTAPLLASVTNRTVHEGSKVSFFLSGSDSDQPANILTYSLSNAPPAASVVSGTGAFEWTPGESDVNSTNIITAIVADDGNPILSDSTSFSITVISRPIIQTLTLQTNRVNIEWSAIEGTFYRLQYHSNLDNTSWQELPGDVQATGPTASKQDPSPIEQQRFYRVMVLP